VNIEQRLIEDVLQSRGFIDGIGAKAGDKGKQAQDEDPPLRSA
jgi:hypothetical protein